jgi:hypothetical protein
MHRLMADEANAGERPHSARQPTRAVKGRRQSIGIQKISELRFSSLGRACCMHPDLA